MRRAIWWIRRDLRLSDNQALNTALKKAEVVIPVFVLDPQLLTSRYTSQKRLFFLYEGLRSLDSDLHKIGSTLVIRKGNPREMLRILLTETKAEGIFAEADISPYARKRDASVMSELPLELTPGITVHSMDLLQKPDGTPYRVFTPFRKMWQSLPLPGKPLPAPEHLSAPPILDSLRVPDLGSYEINDRFSAGEAQAQQRLLKFTGRFIADYNDNRNRMDIEGTSGLSPYLRFGMLSARQVALAAWEAEALAADLKERLSAQTWLNELVWREFYAEILFYFPYVRNTAYQTMLRKIQWLDDPVEFTAWTEGLTGYPIVDAAMRQLNESGWMHNRGRMITASFLTKDLLINWQKGEQYFMQHLLDGDPAANNGGWQWTAGTGTDAAPYFRIFNPVLQGKKFDPKGDFVRHWIPELAIVPDEFIHMPWKMPHGMQVKSGCLIGKNYPAPIVDHARARQRVMVTYGEAAR